MTQVIDINELREKIDSFFNSIPKRQWNFFHKKTIENFLLHLPKIKGRSEKEEILILLNQFIETASNEQELTLKFSKQMFDKYLYPIGNKLEFRLGFLPLFGISVIHIVIPVLITFFLIAFFISKYFFYFLLVIFIGYVAILIPKIKSRKVYGLRY